ncbi:MAG TPA: ATP synthase F1 subunit gamma [Gaiellaceae bacterium]|nr:ATP synthase F1 subunit gamma [Gaiellaceae bacterium]
MATLHDIKRRIRSVGNTRKITKAMELVAGARLRRAEERIIQLRDYADRMQELTAGTARAASSLRGLTLLQRREPRTVAIVALSGDRGLAGAFNGQILRRAFALERSLRAEGQDVRWLAVGRKGRSTLQFRRYELDQSWVGFTDRPVYADAQAVAHRLTELYSSEEIDRAVLVYNSYVSPLVQRVTEQQVLPISPEVLAREEEEEERLQALLGDFIYEPEPEQILERLLPVYVETEVYRALLESAASEHGARMTAMRNASKNAAELIDSLTLDLNRARQAEITQEILEVVAGADALTA